MRRSSPIAYAVIAACTIVAVPGSLLLAQQQPPVQQATATQSAGDVMAPYLEALRTAPTPSTAVDAYARAFSVNPQDPALDPTYVRRAIDLGMPDLAEYQAQQLLGRDSGNGLAHAVMAYAAAKRDDMATALGEIVVAADRLPTDPFVVTTAAQLMAWYDLSRDPQQVAKVPANVRESLRATRTRLGSNPTFTDAYARAREATLQNQNSQQTSAVPQPQAPQELAQPPGPTVYAPPADSTAYSEYVYPPYAYSPTVVVGSPYYYPPLPPAYYGRPWRPHHHDQDHDHHGDGHDDDNRPDRPDRPGKPDAGNGQGGGRPARTNLIDRPSQEIVIRPVNPNPRPPVVSNPKNPQQPREVAGPRTPTPAAPAPSAPSTITRPAPTPVPNRPTPRADQVDAQPARPVRPAPPASDRPQARETPRSVQGERQPQRSEQPRRSDAQNRSAAPAFPVAPNPTISAPAAPFSFARPPEGAGRGTPDVSTGGRGTGTTSLGGRSTSVDISNPQLNPGVNLVDPPSSGSIDIARPPRSGSIDLNNPPRGGTFDLNNPPRGGTFDLNNPPRGGSIDLNSPPRGGSVNIASPPPSPFMNVASPPPSRAPNIAQPPPSGPPSVSGTGGAPQPTPAPTTITRVPSAPDVSGTRPNGR